MTEYEIGYGKPPADGHFKPGVSGNPKGRPKRQTTALSEVIGEVLTSRMPFREKGRLRHATRQELVLRAVVARALAGDLKAAEEVLRQVHRALRSGMASMERVEITDWWPDYAGQTASQKTAAVADRVAAPTPARDHIDDGAPIATVTTTSDAPANRSET